MNYKSVISVFLLLCYFVGFAHGIVPHHHHGNLSEGLSTELGMDHHHEHSEDDAHNHEHIQHHDHLDAGLFDMLLCILSETEHNTSGTDHWMTIPILGNKQSEQSIAKLKLAAVVASIFNIVEVDAPKFQVAPANVTLSSNSHFADNSERGPPSIS